MSTQAVETDGRKARRDRNRFAVIESMISLVLDQGELPPTEMVAERAGVSVSSVFRYFDNLEDLQQQTIETYFERFGSFFEIDDVGAGSFDDRIDRFIDARTTLHETVAPIARLARAKQQPGSPVSDRLSDIRATFADQVRDHFAAELSPLGRSAARSAADAVDVLTSFEAWDLLHSAHDRSAGDIRRTWALAIRRILVDG